MAEYLHPSTRSRIIDNSNVFVTAAGQTMLFAAFPAEKGPDNRPLRVTSATEFTFYYGEPNMRKYGQTAYNVVNWLNAGGVAICVRVLPYVDEDEQGAAIQPSNYAAVVLEVGTLMDTAAPGTPAASRKTRVRVRQLGDGGTSARSASAELAVRTDESLQAIVLAAPGAPEADHYKYFPVCVIRGKDRGSHYNGFGPSIDLMDALDEDFDHRTYQLNLFSSPSSAVEGPFTVSFHPEAQDISKMSQFIGDVVNRNSSVAQVVFSEDNYDAVCKYINANPANWKKLDIFSLQERNVAIPETLHAGVALASTSDDLSPASDVYLPFGGGTDGAWEGPNELEALLYKAYSGTGDAASETTGENLYDTFFSSVLNKDEYPIDLMLDGNLPQSVKVAMNNLAAGRGDCMAILDVGFTSSSFAAEKFRKENLTVSTYFSAIFGQDWLVYDAFQGNDIRVTSTFHLASKIPQTDIEYGIQYPFVGPRRGTIAEYKSCSWFPGPDERERLYKLKVNYAERNASRGTVAFMSQSTSQVSNSALSDISHVRTLLRIRREVEAMCQDYRFEFNDDETWNQLQYSLNNYLNTWVSNRALTQVNGTIYASDYDKQQRILRVAVDMTFTGLIERVFIDLSVNR